MSHSMYYNRYNDIQDLKVDEITYEGWKFGIQIVFTKISKRIINRATYKEHSTRTNKWVGIRMPILQE